MELFRSPPRSQKVVVVTGCGSGLGLALARNLRAMGQFRVLATTHTEKSAKALAQELGQDDRFQVWPLDVTVSAEREALIDRVMHLWKSVDVLINNAAVSYRSVIEHMDEEAEFHQMDVNYFSPMALTRLVVPIMREQQRGQIINVSSVSGLVAMPTMASYSASKHALEGATEALWYELRPYGISVHLVQPGFIHSNSFEKVYFSKKASLSQAVVGPYSEYYQHMGSLVEMLMRRAPATPEAIARRIIKVITKTRAPLWNSVTPDASLFFILRKLLPRALFHHFIYLFLPHVREWGYRALRSKPAQLERSAK